MAKKEIRQKKKIHAQRRFERTHFEGTVVVVHRQRFGFEAGAEISEGGMLLKVDRPFKVGDIFEVSFVVSGRDFYAALAEVAYVLEPEEGERCVGVRFLPTTPKLQILQEEIRRYVSSNSAAA